MVHFDLSIPSGQPPRVTNETILANGFGQRADKDAFLVDPTGLARGSGKQLSAQRTVKACPACNSTERVS
ncbi:MAG: hypothetical protein ACREDC_07490 [Bradyrhizobium sp.]